MRVCHITSVHNQYDSRILHKECKSIAEAGHEVFLLVLNGQTERVEGVQIVGVPFTNKGRVTRILKAGKALLKEAIILNADIYHLHDPELLRIASKLKKKSLGKVIYDSHEDLPKQVLDKHWIPKIIRKIVSKFVHNYEHRVTRRIDGVISVTEKICNRFKEANKNVTLVANYPVIAEFDKYTTSIAKRKNTICYVGGLSPTRGIKELVEALPKTNATLILAGKFVTSGFESEIKALKGWESVEFLGQVNRTKIVEILQCSELGIVTLHPTESYKEALPIKMFEYMAASIPFVASNFIFWENIIFNVNCGVTADPLNINDISSKINYLLENKEKSTKMGENGRKAVLERYSWETQVENLLDLYTTVLN